MITVPGYTLIAPVCEAGDLLLYRAIRPHDGLHVLIKFPAAPRPASTILRRLEREYELARDLDPSLIARPLALERHGGTVALILEQGPDRTLAGLSGSPMEIQTFLRIAIGITAALTELHRHELIHKDIKPEHVLLDEEDHVWLTGLGIASRLPRERQAPELPEVIAGTLAYMSPEQTGRMNRSIDSRSDLYSLGIIFYRMLTSVLPFAADDPMELVHCHIARQPLPPTQLTPRIPELLSAMVMKLLAKSAEERYLSSSGLDADLRRCLAQWESNGRIDSFPLGEHDVPDRLLIPEKLYGRKKEIDALLAAFDRVVTDGMPEIVLVSGYSGIGKTSLVNELHKALVPPRGLFAAGKFDQYKRDIPYATLVQALQSLVRQILGKSEADMAAWREAIQTAVSPNGQLIVSLIPEVELIIGKQPPVPDLPPQESKNRFQMVLRRFLGVFTGSEHPLALFLDDLQWLDGATLDLIEQLVIGQEVRHLLLIGAYRENEVGSTHPLMRIIEAIRKRGSGVREIVLAPLAIDDVGSLIADSLHCDRERAIPLAQLVHDKTGGNPFFAIQFLIALADEKLLAFDPDAGHWSWDLVRIHAKGYTDNVVDLMTGQLGRLPATTLEALKQFACLGNVAEIATLNMVCGQSEEALHAALWETVHAGLVIRQEKTYAFLHDRVQEAAYSLIPEATRAEAHRSIGRLLLAHTPEEKREETIFEIVNQLNRGAALIVSKAEREDLAALNLTAAKRAKASTAYASALTYLAAGAALLAEDLWERQHDLAFSLEINRAECEFLTGATIAADERLAALSYRAANTVERAIVTCLRVDIYTAQSQPDRAVAVGLDYLRQHDIDWSPHPADEEVRLEYGQIWSKLGNRAIAELIDLPLMDDPASLATMDVLIKMWPPAVMTDPNLESLVICRGANLSLERGNCDGSCLAYIYLGGVVAGGRFNDYRAGFQFGQLGYELVERRGLRRYQARAFVNFADLVLPWAKHVRTSQDLLRRAFGVANESGDLTYAMYSRGHLDTFLFAGGASLDEVQREAEFGFEIALKAKFVFVIDWITTHLSLIRTLRGLKPQFGSFGDAQFDEQEFERHLSNTPGLKLPECWYWIRKLQARFFAGDYAVAIDAAQIAQRMIKVSLAWLERGELAFYAALSYAASCASATPDQRQQLWEALTVHYRQLVMWAENCPDNFENRRALVAAEIARLEGRALDAENQYEQAIRSARDNGFVQNEALAYELASAFYRDRGFDRIADAYLRDARDDYARWGAQGKVRQLEQRYPQLREEESPLTPLSTISMGAQDLDILAVVRASQAISGELLLDNVLKTLMRIVLESAGVQRGSLLLYRKELLTQAASASVENQGIVIHAKGEPGFAEAELPASILNYVSRSRDKVIIDDAASPNPYSADQYFSRYRPKSVLCFPITKQTRLIGLLYLENDVATYAFTPNRLAVLELLAAQAAISLETAGTHEALRLNELRYRLGQTSAHIGTWEYDLMSERFWASDEARRIYGLPLERSYFLPDEIEACIPERERAHQALLNLIAKSAPYNLEFEIRPADGSEARMISSVAELFRDDQGTPLKVVGVIQDISERKRAEEDLRRMNERFVLATHAGQVGVWDWDIPKNELVWDDSMYSLYGIQKGDFGGAYDAWASIIHPQDKAHTEEEIQAALRSEREYAPEFRIVRPDGTIRYIKADSQTLRDEGGKPLRMIGTNIDITEHKRAEKVTQARLRMLEAVYAADMTLDDTQRLLLDEIEAQTGSRIGFYHFLEEDQQTLSLQNWSTNTLAAMCAAEGKGSHYPVAEAGVWADCARERRPVIHNDYTSLSNRRGMPDGHVAVVRELVVPIFRGPRIVAIIGVGNKPEEYNETDVQIASLLGDFSWEIVIRMQAVEDMIKLNAELESRVTTRTAELVARSDELEQKNRELDRFNKLFVNRELRMIEMKERIAELEEKLNAGRLSPQ